MREEKTMVTGKMIHEAFSIATSDVNLTKDWSEITEQARARYEIMAMHLNEQDEEPSCSEQEYISEVLRTCVATGFGERLLLGVMGLAGESGEVVDLAKKARFQGHSIDTNKVKDELGDVMWYLGLLCHTLGLTLQEVRAENVAKMHRRYPNGFEVERSVNREHRASWDCSVGPSCVGEEEMTPQERDIQTRQAFAIERRERDALLRRDRQAENIAVGLDVLCKILSAANTVFEEDISLSMLPDESVDGTAASAALHCVEIEYLGWYTWRVRSRLFQYDAYVKDWDGNQHFTPFTSRTTQGSCSQICQCGYCQALRRATVQVRRPQHVE